MNEMSELPSGTEIDLSNCEREPLRFAGRIQSFAFLLAITDDKLVAHASANCSELFGRDVEEIIGLPLREVLKSQAIHDIMGTVQALGRNQGLGRMFHYDLFGDGRLFHIALGRANGRMVVEFEPVAEATTQRNHYGLVQSLSARVSACTDLDRL